MIPSLGTDLRPVNGHDRASTCTTQPARPSTSTSRRPHTTAKRIAGFKPSPDRLVRLLPHLRTRSCSIRRDLATPRLRTYLTSSSELALGDHRTNAWLRLRGVHPGTIGPPTRCSSMGLAPRPSDQQPREPFVQPECNHQARRELVLPPRSRGGPAPARCRVGSTSAGAKSIQLVMARPCPKYRDGVATIEYRCPTHGKVEPLDASAGVPVCSLTLVCTIDGEARAEPCGQPLTAYFE